MSREFFKKESPLLGLAGMGGGIARGVRATAVLGNRSLRFSDTSTYLNRTPGSTTNRLEHRLVVVTTLF